MGESNLHKYLKLLGIQYLDQQGCRLIATEIYVRKSASDLWLNGDDELKQKADRYHRYFDGIEAHLKQDNDTDSKWIIDVLAVGSKDILVEETDPKQFRMKRKVGSEILIRGIEVKVSRSDFKNGYCQTGLNYHYILCPELLVKKSEIPKHMGLLYWDRKYPSVYCAKRPRKQKLNADMGEYYRDAIFSRYHSQIMSMTRDQLVLLSASLNETKQRTSA